MQALELIQYGTPPTTAWTELPERAPGPDEILISVRAAALNPLDAKIASGAMAQAMPQTLPTGIASDVSGEVTAIGSGVDRFAIGDAVVAMVSSPWGAIADKVLTSATNPALAAKPSGLADEQAALVPMVGTTAHTILRALRPAVSAIVIGGSGYIGRFLLPALRDLGITVITTGPSNEMDRLHRAGAVETVGFAAADLDNAVARRFPGGVDLVIDLIHQLGDLPASARFLLPGGQLVSSLFGPDKSAFPDGTVVTYIRNAPQRGDLDAALAAVERGEVELGDEVVRERADAASLIAAYTERTIAGKPIIRLQ